MDAQRVLTAIDNFTQFAGEHPVIIGAAAILAVLFIVNWTRPAMPRRDPKRRFDRAQTQAGMSRAGHQCEMGTFIRCRQASAHGDHFFPHTRGGASNLTNFVAACQRHNLSKGAKMPSRSLQFAIEVRRARYFPPGQNRTAGCWFGRSS